MTPIVAFVLLGELVGFISGLLIGLILGYRSAISSEIKGA